MIKPDTLSSQSLVDLITRPLVSKPIQEMPEYFNDVLHGTHQGHVLLTNQGKPEIVMLDYALFENLQHLVHDILKKHLSTQSDQAFEQVFTIDDSQPEPELPECELEQLIEQVIAQDRIKHGIRLESGR